MEIVSVRIPKELKEEMRRLDVDWADYIRKAVEAKIREEKIRTACKVMDEIRAKTVGIKFDSVKVIREARESR